MVGRWLAERYADVASAGITKMASAGITTMASAGRNIVASGVRRSDNLPIMAQSNVIVIIVKYYINESGD